MFREYRFRKEDDAQIHVLEAVVAAMLFFGALQVGTSLIPSDQSTTGLTTLSVTGEDSIRSLYLLDPGIPNGSDFGNSSLIYFLISGMYGNITSFLNSTIDPSISYTLFYRILPENTEITILEMLMLVDESVSAHFPFHYKGKLYDVILLLWKEPRGMI